MKKNLIAGAALLALAVGAQAQSNVQVMGTADVYVGSIQMAGDKASTSKLDGGGMTTSWFGFKGSEDLGNGLKAEVAYTAFINPSNGTMGNRFPGDTSFSRDANVALAGGFGRVQVGRGLAPNFLPSIIFNPLGDSFTFSPLVLHMNVPLFNGSGWADSPARSSPSDTGWNSEVLYSTPNFGGLTANVHYQLGNQSSTSTNPGAKNIGLNVLYFNGPLALTAFYEKDQVANPGAAPAPFAAAKTDWMVGGSYDMKVVKLFGTYGGAKNEATNNSGKTTSLGLSSPVGAGKIVAAYARTTIDTNAVKAGSTARTTTTVGYDYDLSKRTDVYAMLMNDQITNLSTGTSFGVGIRHKF